MVALVSILTLAHDVVNEFAVYGFSVIQSPVFDLIPCKVEILCHDHVLLVVIQQAFLVVRCPDLSSFLAVVMAHDGHVVMC